VKLKFSKNLCDLEIYLELTNWLWQYILYYVYITELLQECKTMLIRQVFQKNHLWQVFVRKILINSSSKKKLKVYQCLQMQFAQDLFLIHFNFKKILYIDLNALKKQDFEVMLFHLKENWLYSENSLSRNLIKSIIFLSRKLNSAEKNYWSTELEIACLV